jgi:hypothetical protein
MIVELPPDLTSVQIADFLDTYGPTHMFTQRDRARIYSAMGMDPKHAIFVGPSPLIYEPRTVAQRIRNHVIECATEKLIDR